MKKYLLGIMALVFAIGLSAFSTKPHPGNSPVKKGGVTLQWFDFNGTSEDQYNTVSYYSADAAHQNPCTGSGLRCEIYAPVRTDAGHVGEPDLLHISDETLKP